PSSTRSSDPSASTSSWCGSRSGPDRQTPAGTCRGNARVSSGGDVRRPRRDRAKVRGPDPRDRVRQALQGRDLSLYGPFFTPESSGYGQSDGRRAHERFVERYSETGSLRPGDYAKVSRNATYLIGLLIAAGVSQT